MMLSKLFRNDYRLLMSRVQMCGVLAVLALVSTISTAQAEAKRGLVDAVEQGRKIYQEGILTSGKALVGERFDNIKVEGSQAACVNCHRHSGMGAVEGDIRVAPITGKYLFSSDRTNVATMDPRIGKGFNQKHAPYTVATLEKTLASGINNNGLQMNVVMPHYTLDKKDLSALVAYLKQLSSQPSPGVTDEFIHFATVVAPDVEPERRQAMLDIIRAVVAQKNGSTVVGTQRGGRRHMVSAAELILGTERKWVIDEWALSGAPSTWGEQLKALYAKQPVFALISGVGNATWEPVSDFCQEEKVPCWFPSVPLPPNDPGFYTAYFSQGVALEATIFAKSLTSRQNGKPARVLQIFRPDFAGLGASNALQKALEGAGVAVENRPIVAATPDFAQLLSGLNSGDVVMLWLRRGDMANMAALTPVKGVEYVFSGSLAGGESAPFPPALMAAAKLIYPFELPEKRLLYTRNFYSWMNMRKLKIVDEPLQAEVYFAMRFLTETVSEMLDNLYRDYLLDRMENMLSKSETLKAEQQSREVAALGIPAELLKRHPRAKPLASTVQLPPGAVGNPDGRQSTSIYPRLSLGIGQRFASKGAYIVRFDQGGKVITDSEWATP